MGGGFTSDTNDLPFTEGPTVFNGDGDDQRDLIGGKSSLRRRLTQVPSSLLGSSSVAPVRPVGSKGGQKPSGALPPPGKSHKKSKKKKSKKSSVRDSRPRGRKWDPSEAQSMRETGSVSARLAWNIVNREQKPIEIGLSDQSTAKMTKRRAEDSTDSESSSSDSEDERLSNRNSSRARRARRARSPSPRKLKHQGSDADVSIPPPRKKRKVSHFKFPPPPPVLAALDRSAAESSPSAKVSDTRQRLPRPQKGDIQ